MEIKGLEVIEKWINSLTFDQLMSVYEHIHIEELEEFNIDEGCEDV